jgi:hypothetical protein
MYREIGYDVLAGEGGGGDEVAGLTCFSSLQTTPFAALAYFRNLVGQQWSQSVKLPGVGYLLTVSAARQK